MKNAKFLRMLPGWRGDARLFELSEPMAYSNVGEDETRETRHVVVSAVVAFGQGPETYIFPSGPDGVVGNYLELEGSFKGDLCHNTALSRAGYEVVP